MITLDMCSIEYKENDIKFIETQFLSTTLLIIELTFLN